MSKENPGKFSSWLKRIGLAGFLFFFLKGLIWLGIFFGAFQLSSC